MSGSFSDHLHDQQNKDPLAIIVDGSIARITLTLNTKSSV